MQLPLYTKSYLSCKNFLAKFFMSSYRHARDRTTERLNNFVIFRKVFFFSTSLVTYLEKCPSSLHKMGEKIIWTKGLTSADRSNKATLLLTVPRSI